MSNYGSPRELLCPDCGHHLHNPDPVPCEWRDCSCGAGRVVDSDPENPPQNFLAEIPDSEGGLGLDDRRTRYLAQAIVDNVNFDEDIGRDGNLCRYCILVMPNHSHDCAFVIATEVLAAPED